MVVHSSHFGANRAMFGGAIFNFNGDLYIESSTFDDNHAESAGGAVRTQAILATTERIFEVYLDCRIQSNRRIQRTSVERGPLVK